MQFPRFRVAAGVCSRRNRFSQALSNPIFGAMQKLKFYPQRFNDKEPAFAIIQQACDLEQTFNSTTHRVVAPLDRFTPLLNMPGRLPTARQSSI